VKGGIISSSVNGKAPDRQLRIKEQQPARQGSRLPIRV